MELVIKKVRRWGDVLFKAAVSHCTLDCSPFEKPTGLWLGQESHADSIGDDHFSNVAPSESAQDWCVLVEISLKVGLHSGVPLLGSAKGDERATD